VTVDAELRAAIVDDPDAIDNWLVYADWLSDRGDPRGEQIMLGLAIEAKTLRAGLIDNHAWTVHHERLLMSSALVEQAHQLDLFWWRGSIDRARIRDAPDGPPPRAVLETLLEDPHACLLRALDLGRTPSHFAGIHSEVVRELWCDASSTRQLAIADDFPNLVTLMLMGLVSLAESHSSIGSRIHAWSFSGARVRPCSMVSSTCRRCKRSC
jgi:uncharacterized protein (TIGR02996 family)